MVSSPLRVRVGHSPDPDDAFMVWAIHAGRVRDERFQVELLPRDIETLNRWAVAGTGLEATALSAAAYARVADRYWLLPHGASFGDGYGPVVVTRGDVDLRAAVVAAPGELTTAFAALRLAVPGVRCEHVPFEEILPAVARGDFAAGLLIHEGQLTWARHGLRKALDLGAWWKDETGLPLPLGVNALSRALGDADGARLGRLLRESVEAGLRFRADALAYARGFGRGIGEADADRFVSMYVNEMTRDMGARGRLAVETFLSRAAEAGLAPPCKVEMAP
ncbi:MAG TPA: MqnA/MqnD/SBP family protein [Candidatus Thermoplasmatota archaeon]|nr:MqnA/MqnD/SBP family protein [Candidatus Thermoplasmatota archaeon]